MSEANKMIKHASLYAIGTISARLVGFLMLPVYTRYLTPEDYGVIGLITMLISVIEGIFGVRLVQAISKFYYESSDPVARKLVVSTGYLLTSAFSFLVVVCMVIYRAPLANLLFNSTEHADALGLLAVGVWTQALEFYGFMYLRIQQRAVSFLKLSLAKLALQLGLNILFVVTLEMGVLGVALGNFIAYSVMAIYLSQHVLRQVGLNFCKALAKRMVRFSWPLWIAGLGTMYISASQLYSIRVFDSVEGVGLYALAQKFSMVIAVLVWTPFVQYWETERFEVYNRGQAKELFPIVFELVMALITLGALGLTIFAPMVVQFMAAEPFHAATSAIGTLSLAEIFVAAIWYCSFSLYLREKTVLVGRATWLCAIAATLFYWLLVPSYGFNGAAVAYAAACFLQFMFLYWLSLRTEDVGIRLKPFLVIVLVPFTVYFVTRSLPAVEPIVQTWLGAALYFLVLAVVPVGMILRRRATREYGLQAASAIANKLGLGQRA